MLIEDGRVVVPALVVSSSAGAVRVGGDISPDGRLDLTVSAAGLVLGRIARALGRDAIQGVAYLSGSVRGTVRDPLLSARVRVLGPGYRSYNADIATGSVTATRTRVTLGGDVVVRRFPATATLAGAVTNLQGGAAPRPDRAAR